MWEYVSLSGDLQTLSYVLLQRCLMLYLLISFCHSFLLLHLADPPNISADASFVALEKLHLTQTGAVTEERTKCSLTFH